MRYIRFIAAFIAIFATTSCFVDDIEQVEVPSEGRDDVTVVARVARFDDREVDTRGTKNDAEAKVTCMAVAIFPIDTENDAIGNCVFYDFREGSQLLFTINRQETKNGAYIYNVGEPYVMYVFANLPSMTEETCANMTLDQMKAMAYSVESVKIPTNGFPMVGSLGDTITPEGDGKTFILKPGEPANPTLPLVNGEESDLLNVPMKAMFAKVNFTIKVTPDQTVDTHLTPQFTLKSYTVNNVPASVDFAMGGKPRLNHSVTDDITSVIGPFKDPMPLLNGTTIARGTQTINFTFYLPERFLTPTYQSHDGSQDGGKTGYYDYPFPVVNGKYRAEDLDLRQRFKPLLPDGQAATYVTINGTFRDHQQHEFDVTYDVYLGNDNYGNFDTERNCEYFHYINIRGILNSDDQVAYGPGEMPVSIDHRVNVNRVEPIIINLRRETLLDSHFEVRPLRIRKNPDYKGDLSNAKVKVEVVYDKTPTQKWIGLERSFGHGAQSGSTTYLATYLVATDLAADRQNSKGKRKYFTTDLTTSTLAGESQKDGNGYSTTGGQSVIVPVTAEDEAVWIYVDEALVAEAGDAIRKATIRVSVAEDGENYGTPIDYVIQQRQLFPVTFVDDNGTPNNKTDDKTYEYLIEYEEEYLHNFDADDSYGQTDFEGMQWGLPNIQLSYDHSAISFNQILADTFTSERKANYDYYVEEHDSDASGEMHNRVGFDFCSEIIQVVNGQGDHDTDDSNNIDVLHLGQDPESAIEYCYNKNKRNANGQVATSANSDNMKWYLPAIDQIEDIVMSEYGDGQKTYTRFLDFQDKYYWSCQPSYIRNYAWYSGTITQFFGAVHGAYYIDDTQYARATSVSYTSGTYKNSPSGVVSNTYYSFWYFYQRILFGKTDETYYDGNRKYDGMTETITPGPVQREAGNKPRTSYARVRCVRKAN